jgi:hypothetical protein
MTFRSHTSVSDKKSVLLAVNHWQGPSVADFFILLVMLPFAPPLSVKDAVSQLTDSLSVTFCYSLRSVMENLKTFFVPRDWT